MTVDLSICDFEECRLSFEYDHEHPDNTLDVVKLAPSACLEYHDGDNGCRGAVEFHTVGSSLKAFPRCVAHFDQRLDRYENSIERYADSDVPPSWFKPSWGGVNEYGERWDDY